MGETFAVKKGAEGESENSQAKGPGLDDTLESDLSPKKQFLEALCRLLGRIFQVNIQRRIEFISVRLFLCSKTGKQQRIPEKTYF